MLALTHALAASSPDRPEAVKLAGATSRHGAVAAVEAAARQQKPGQSVCLRPAAQHACNRAPAATAKPIPAACCVHAQFQQGLADPAAKSALIGDWTGTTPGASSSLFAVGQAAAKPVWDAGKAQPKVTETKRVGAAVSNAVGGPGRWREDERDGPAARGTDRFVRTRSTGLAWGSHAGMRTSGV